jgi:hypothetical protein
MLAYEPDYRGRDLCHEFSASKRPFCRHIASESGGVESPSVALGMARRAEIRQGPYPSAGYRSLQWI